MIFNEKINGIQVNATYSEEDINNRYIPFLKSLTELQKKKGRRILVLLAAPPGCGKTTLLHFLKKLSEETDGLTPVTIIGMDGFHHYQDWLLSHTTVRDGVEMPMVRIKGAPETFDLEKLTEAVKNVASGKSIGWPEYDRILHNPVENAVSVNGDIVLLEGNYLLLEEDGWKELKKFADVTVSLTADEKLLKDRLVDRQQKSGKAYDDAVRFVEFSDLVNVRTVLEKSVKADIIWNVE